MEDGGWSPGRRETGDRERTSGRLCRAARAFGGSATPFPILWSEWRGSGDTSRRPGPKPPQAPRKLASPRLRRPGAPAATAEPAAVFIPGARARTAGRRDRGEVAGGERRPARPRPVGCGPAPLRGPLHPGLRDPPLRPGSAARCRVWGLAEGRASLRKATSRPFLQCE